MNILSELKKRFTPALATLVDDPADLLSMIRPAQDPKFGDYQANFAMPLGKRLGKSPREIATDIVGQVQLEDLCLEPEIAGPGFINLRLRDDWVSAAVQNAIDDPGQGVSKAEKPLTYIVDFSSPNVAKPMHVGHIRSTVIGDALARTLRFVGHKVITDNHLGDWGTQFGMIIYGYKNFVDRAAYEEEPVAELGRLYRYVRRIMDYHAAHQRLPQIVADTAAVQKQLDALNEKGAADKSEMKRLKKERRRLEEKLKELVEDQKSKQNLIDSVRSDPALLAVAEAHAGIGQAVTDETAMLHAGDAENQELWEEFLPHCREDIQKIYQRLGVSFDHELGESFYHDQLGTVVESLEEKGLARESEGAVCVFMDDYETPMIVRKKDGAYLYATTDLATVQYRMSTWRPDAILYVVDHRQHEHFAKLFDAIQLWGYSDCELTHVSFGTVMGADGKPYKTRSGDTVGLEGLLDEAEQRALKVVEQMDSDEEVGPRLDADERLAVANTVGIGSLKYADLSQNRTTDYIFSYDKMLALVGNTAVYIQYSYARVRGIFTKGGVDPVALRHSPVAVSVAEPAERALALQLLRFSEALDDVLDDYRPNLLTSYLFDLSKAFASFFEQCPVLKADSEETKTSRLKLCDLTARVIKQGLELLGIDVAERM